MCCVTDSEEKFNIVTEIWITLTKAFVKRAGAHRSYVQALGKLADYWHTGAWERGKVLMLVPGKSRVKYTEIRAANMHPTGFIYKN